jgi:AraC-like DNA-binding protein
MFRQAITSVLALDGDVRFSRHDPDARLAGAVVAYWTLTVATQGAILRVIPDGCIDAIFDLDTREAFVSGPVPLPFEVRHERPTRLLGATLSPAAAAAFLGVEIGAIGPGWRRLDALLGPLAARLAERVAAGETTEAKIAALESLLLARIGAPDRRVARAIETVAGSAGRVGVAALGRTAGASPRNLARLFDRWVGLSPKKFARIARVQEVLRRMQDSPAPSLKALAAELGFADQAHLSREVKTLAGDGPGRMAESFKRESESFKP